MMTVSEVHDVFLMLYERAVADNASVARITRFHRTLERLGCPEDDIELAYLRGRAVYDCAVNGPPACA